MGAPVYTTDLQNIALGEAGETWGEPAGALGGGMPAAGDADMFVQGTACASKSMNTTGQCSREGTSLSMILRGLGASSAVAIGIGAAAPALAPAPAVTPVSLPLTLGQSAQAVVTGSWFRRLVANTAKLR